VQRGEAHHQGAGRDGEGGQVPHRALGLRPCGAGGEEALAHAQQRFALAGRLVERVTPADAVILASLHSGSLRYYAHRPTIDWGKIPPGHFDSTLAALQRAGRPVFLLLDAEEERQQFVSRHGHVIDDQRWLPSGEGRDLLLFQAPAP